MAFTKSLYFNSYTSPEGKLAIIDRTRPGQNDRYDFDPNTTTLEKFCETMGLQVGKVFRIAPAYGYKDWNDQLQNVRMEEQVEDVQENETEDRHVGLHR